MIYLNFAAFFAMQVTANLFFSYGSRDPSRWLLYFVLGNVVGASSIWFMMLLYKNLQPNTAMAIAGGGTFILVQVALALAFRSNLNIVQWCGILAIVVGITLTSLFATPTAPKAEDTTRKADRGVPGEQTKHSASLEEYR